MQIKVDVLWSRVWRGSSLIKILNCPPNRRMKCPRNCRFQSLKTVAIIKRLLNIVETISDNNTINKNGTNQKNKIKMGPFFFFKLIEEYFLGYICTYMGDILLRMIRRNKEQSFHRFKNTCVCRSDTWLGMMLK